MTMRRTACVVIAGIVLVSTAASGSGHAQAPPSTGGAPAATDDQPLAELKKRVLAYWEARVKKDYRAEYDLLEPRARARVSPDEYGRGRTVQYLAVQVEGAEQNGNFARVNVRLLVRLILPIPARVQARTDSTQIEDHWVLIGGAWYRSSEADAGVAGPWPVASQ